jgi:hypothetical protein
MAAMLLLGAGAECSAAERLVVRMYGYAGLAGDEMAAARETASAILRIAGVEILWRDCSTGCAELLRPHEVLLRIVAAPPSSPPESLGCSVVDVERRTGVLSTVYADRIVQAAHRTGTDVGRLAGRAIAHELGHLLLGTSRHSSAGLMRALWADHELQRELASDWTWRPEDLAQLARAQRPPVNAD